MKSEQVDTRIVCTHDALKIAEVLMRLLDAEEHRTRLSYGRQSLLDLELSKSSTEAVVLIWSHEAPGAHYMLEWARSIPADRLVEISRTSEYPKIPGRVPVIDFASWRGERGGRAWNALTERLRTITRALEPPKPAPKRAVLALGLASAAAVVGAMVVRVNDTITAEPEVAASEDVTQIAITDPASGVGGPLSGMEPASMDEAPFRYRPLPRVPLIEPLGDTHVVMPPEYVPIELREPTLMERISAFNPLRGDGSDDEPEATPAP